MIRSDCLPVRMDCHASLMPVTTLMVGVTQEKDVMLMLVLVLVPIMKMKTTKTSAPLYFY